MDILDYEDSSYVASKFSLPQKPPRRRWRMSSPGPLWTNLIDYARTPIRVDTFIEVQLLILTLSTGIQDADSFPNFHCFASNQTGNTVLLALGLSGYKSNVFDIHNVAVSLSLFLTGALLTGQVLHRLGKRRRGWQFLSNLLQTMMVIGAASMQFAQGAQQTGPWALGSIALLAFSSGSQVATARAMQIPEITTAMATAAWVDLVIDPRLVVVKNHSRNRRALFLAALAGGSFVGAVMHLQTGSSWALLVSGILKAGVSVMVLISKPHQVEEQRAAREAV
ncbi:hypothetical protein MMC10_006271 [Thelotrema lepadinum]|nr:hypothetical protein [Thelotrema lepadinum]